MCEEKRRAEARTSNEGKIVTSNLIRFPSALPLVLVLGAIFGTVGCSDSAAGLTLTSIKTHKEFADTFTNAYATRNINGNLDVVLVDYATEQALASGRFLGPAHQIMHIRVLWSPTRDMKPDDPADSNASIHWYIMGAGRDRAAPMIQYSGTAFVYTSKSWTNLLQLDIRNATLKPVIARGDVQDPIGPSKVEGTVYARTSERIVNQLLAEVRQSAAIAER